MHPTRAIRRPSPLLNPKMKIALGDRDTPLEQFFEGKGICAMKEADDRARPPLDVASAP